MEFKKYQHIEKLYHIETIGIDEGECYIFPKIDGCNCSIWWNNGIQAGSRNRQLSIENDHANFYKTILSEQDIYGDFFLDHPDFI